MTQAYLTPPWRILRQRERARSRGLVLLVLDPPLRPTHALALAHEQRDAQSLLDQDLSLDRAPCLRRETEGELVGRTAVHLAAAPREAGAEEGEAAVIEVQAIA